MSPERERSATARGAWWCRGMSTRNGIVANSIAFNGQLGIDLDGDGVTPNDPGDLDRGPNGLQNFPKLYVLPSTRQVGQVRLQVELDSRPGGLYRIDVFASGRPDPSGYGEGQRFIGVLSTLDG